MNATFIVGDAGMRRALVLPIDQIDIELEDEGPQDNQWLRVNIPYDFFDQFFAPGQQVDIEIQYKTGNETDKMAALYVTNVGGGKFHKNGIKVNQRLLYDSRHKDVIPKFREG